MLTVLKNIALEILVLMARFVASVLEHGIGLLVNPMRELFTWLSMKNTDLRLWFYDVTRRLEALKEK